MLQAPEVIVSVIKLFFSIKVYLHWQNARLKSAVIQIGNDAPNDTATILKMTFVITYK